MQKVNLAMYFLIDRRKNLTLRKEIDAKIASLRQAQSGLMLLNDVQPSASAQALLSDVDAELIYASELERSCRELKLVA